MRGLSTLFAMLASLVLATATCVHGPADFIAADDPTCGETFKSGPPAVLTRSSAKRLATNLKTPLAASTIALVVDELPVFGDFHWSPVHPRILSTAGPVNERGPPALL